MKPITIERVIPGSPAVPATPDTVVKETHFACEFPGCTVTVTTPEDMQKHIAAKHAISAETSFYNELTERVEYLQLFKTEAAFTAIYKYFNRDEWKGPGWYRVWQEWQDCTRCSGSRCGHTATHVKFAPQYARDIREKILALKELADTIDSRTGISTELVFDEEGQFDSYETGMAIDRQLEVMQKGLAEK